MNPPAPPRDGPPLPGGEGALPRPQRGRYARFLAVGQGGMGTVYRALDTLLARQVAFKVTRLDAEEGGSAITPATPLAAAGEGVTAEALSRAKTRLLREACLTGGLEHPAITPVYDVGETEAGLPYYTMRFIAEHRTLADELEACAGGDLERRLGLLEPFLKVCDALAYAHARGVIHRDIKPHNVALGAYGEVVLLDWGLATTRASTEAETRGEGAAAWGASSSDSRPASQTDLGILGTPGWIAPEGLAEGSRGLDERSDVFALGVVLFQVLTGRLPWPCEGLRDYAVRLEAAEAPAAVSLDPRLPAPLSDLCASALRREPRERLASAAELGARLRAWRTHSAAEQARAALLSDVGASIAQAEALPPAESLALLDRAAARCLTLIQADRPDPEASALLDRLHVLREQAVAVRERAARRRTLRRVGVLALLVAGVAGVLVALLLEQRRSEAVAAEARAQRERARAEATMHFMLFDLRARLEPLGRLGLLASVAERASEHYRAAEGGSTSLEEDLRRAVALRAVGEVFRARGDLTRALQTFEQAAQAAERTGKDLPTDLALEAALARALVGEVREAQGYRAEGHAAFRANLEALRSLAARDAALVSLRVAQVRAHLRLARSEARRNDVAAGLREAQAARALAESLEREVGDDESLELALTACLEEAQLRAWAKEPGPAAALALEALERARAHAARAPADLRWPRLIADAYVRRILPLAALGDLEAASAAYREGRRIFEREAAAEPSDERWAERAVVLDSRMAEALLRAGRRQEALDILKPALASAEALAARDPTSGHRLHLVVDVTDRVAGAHAGLEQPEEALAARRRNVEASEALAARDPGNAVSRIILGLNVMRLGEALRTLGETLPARDAYERARPTLGPLVREFADDVDLWTATAGSWTNGGSLRAAGGDRPQGLADMRQGLVLFEEGARLHPSTELPYRLAQAQLALAVVVDPSVEAERREGLVLLERVAGWLDGQPVEERAGLAAMRASVEQRRRELEAR